MPSLGTSFGRGGATDYQQDLMNSDCVVIMGSNMAENHPVGFQWAMEMIADRIVRTREETWQEETPEGKPAQRTLGIANLGGATLDNEENYLMKKLLTGLGVVQVENQARI